MISSAEIKNYSIYSDYTPIMRYSDSENFYQWQKRARDHLYMLLGMNEYKECNPCFNIEYCRETDEYTEYRFTIQSEENYFVPSVIRIPKSQAIKKLPLAICLQGHSTGMHISLGVSRFPRDEETITSSDCDLAIRAVKEGYVAVAIEQRAFGECSGNDDFTPGCYLTSMTAILTGRSTVGERVWDVMRVLDTILERFESIDKNKICIIGHSGGGTVAYYSACLDERISLCVPSCSVCSWDMSISVQRHCACNYVPNIGKYFDSGDLAGMIAPRNIIVVHGVLDPIFYKAGVDKSYSLIENLYRHAGAPENCHIVVGSEGHRFYSDLSWPTIHEMMGI